jgi:alkanesulfonate monooxygenase SsuD/methylene tetrahydromethanopterin reductase-like flavin-dependent oxidoreductase (luciferase family)
VFEEVLDIVHLARTGASFSYEGRYFTVPQLRVTPAPVRRPLPVWLGGMSEPGVRRAARYGAPLLLDPLHTVAELEPWVARYRAACAEAGAVPEVKLLRYGWVSDDPGEPDELWWPHMREMFWNYSVVVPRINAAGSKQLLRGATSADELPLDAFAPDRLLVGDAASVSGQLRDMAQRLGADTVIVKLQGERGPWDTPVEQAMRLLAKAAEGTR